ncbi:MAG: hypothetical protein SP4CHLAM5_00300 [Chlamydiia bacterium]|nr:hypothetical protein [Chlamydiia bacterium]MCH9617909.1 hypothetical protein [Chlamydiia bacterium]MCH9624125.1 hypothetical protein [Chlamydiia bacterium]
MNTKLGGIVDILLSIFLIAIAVVVSYYGYMLIFMGIIFLILSVLKLVDITGFTKIFVTYDLLAKKYPVYAYIYPFIELFIAICFLFHFIIIPAAVITIIIMTIGTISIYKNLLSKDKKSCACLGAKINVPLTRFTLVEDILMGVMAFILLFIR